MTRMGDSRYRRGSVDCTQNVSRIASCSSTYPGQSIKQISKKSTSNPQRRSLRLKGISAIYESENACSSPQQQNNAGYKSSVNRIKVEMPFEGDHVNDANDSRCYWTCGNKDTSGDCDVESIDNMTLRDLRTRCKAKRSNAKYSVTSTDADHRNHPHHLVKPKEEEPDLEEPLIVLKSKISKKSTGKRKQRKCEHSSSESSVYVEGTTAQTSSFAFSEGESSPNGLSTDADSCSCNSAVYVAESMNLHVSPKLEFSEDAEENSGVMATQKVSKIESSLSSSEAELKRVTLHSYSPKSILSVKKEITESDVWDGQGLANEDASYASNFSVEDSFVEGSVELLQKGHGNFENEDQICFIVEPLHAYSDDHVKITTQSSPLTACGCDGSLHAGGPQLVHNVTGVLENDSLEENIVYISASSNVDFIAKYISPVTSPVKLERDVGDELEKRELTCSAATGSCCLLNEASTEYIEPEETRCSPESEEHFEGINYTGAAEIFSPMSSPFSFSKLRAYSVGNLHSIPAAINPCSDICDGSENNSISLENIVSDDLAYQMKHSVAWKSNKSIEADNNAYLSASGMVNEDLRNLIDEGPEQALQTSSEESDLAFDHSDPCTKIHDSGDELLVSEMCLRNNEKQNISCICEHSVVGTNCPCSQHSCSSFGASNASHAIDGISTKTEKYLCKNFDQMLHSYSEIYSVNVGRLRDALDCHSPQICLPFNSDVSGSQSAYNESSRVGERLSFLITEENLYASSGKATCPSTSAVQTVETELKFDEGLKEENCPKKLLSNRKTISPNSQEKLCQALNGMDIYDAMQCSKNRKRLLFEKWAGKEISSSISGCAEGEMVGSERMTKKPKRSRNGSCLPVTKGILKSPETSLGKPCSLMKISLMHKQTQEAITFSQRQMHDFESVALKLLKGLKSMKNIVEETLSSEAFLSGTSNLTADELREAANNVSELEATTNKWLSIFTRDCSRFCKIMRARENEAANTYNGVQKERKKITFADEAGGLLCHVKVFELQPASAEEAKSENNDR